MVKTVGSREVMMGMLKLHQHLVLLLVMFHISQSSPRDSFHCAKGQMVMADDQEMETQHVCN
jgi:hypothetical protein